MALKIPRCPRCSAACELKTLPSVSGTDGELKLTVLGMLLFNFPILALFNVSGTLLGVPVLYAYIFIAWAALIALMALVANR